MKIHEKSMFGCAEDGLAVSLAAVRLALLVGHLAGPAQPVGALAGPPHGRAIRGLKGADLEAPGGAEVSLGLHEGDAPRAAQRVLPETSSKGEAG